MGSRRRRADEDEAEIDDEWADPPRLLRQRKDAVRAAVAAEDAEDVGGGVSMKSLLRSTAGLALACSRGLRDIEGARFMN